MRGMRTAVAVVALLGMSTPGWAQTGTAPVSRADAAGTLGWLNAQKTVPNAYRDDNDWYNRSLYGGAIVGWYWTDNWKTEIEGGGSTKGELRGTETRFVIGQPTTVYSTYEFSTSRVTIGQQYQFFRNVWLHPFIGGGIDFTWESIERYDEGYLSLPTPSFVRVEHPEQQEFHTRPFGTLGFKAYMTPRGFFRTDLKFVANSHGLDEVTLRFGFGVDF